MKIYFAPEKKKEAVFFSSSRCHNFGPSMILESFSTDDEHDYEYEFRSFSQLYS